MTEKTEPVDPENFAIDLTDKCQTHEQWLKDEVVAALHIYSQDTGDVLFSHIKCSRDAVRSV